MDCVFYWDYCDSYYCLGSIKEFLAFIKLEHQKLNGKNTCKNRENLRHHLGSYILLSLEFLIVADIIITVNDPGVNQLILLGSLVVIRTIIGFFLDKELGRAHKCKDE